MDRCARAQAGGPLAPNGDVSLGLARPRSRTPSTATSSSPGAWTSALQTSRQTKRASGPHGDLFPPGNLRCRDGDQSRQHGGVLRPAGPRGLNTLRLGPLAPADRAFVQVRSHFRAQAREQPDRAPSNLSPLGFGQSLAELLGLAATSVWDLDQWPPAPRHDRGNRGARRSAPRAR